MAGLATASALDILNLLATRVSILQVTVMSEGTSQFKMVIHRSHRSLFCTNTTNSLLHTNTVTQYQATIQRGRMSRGHLSPTNKAIPPRRWAAIQTP